MSTSLHLFSGKVSPMFYVMAKITLWARGSADLNCNIEALLAVESKLVEFIFQRKFKIALLNSFRTVACFSQSLLKL